MTALSGISLRAIVCTSVRITSGGGRTPSAGVPPLGSALCGCARPPISTSSARLLAGHASDDPVRALLLQLEGVLSEVLLVVRVGVIRLAVTQKLRVAQRP